MADLNNIKIQDIPGHNDGADFYENFRQKLIDVETFPSLYVFKFIAPASIETKQQIEKLFEHPSTKISTKDSKTGKYNSFTIETFVSTADQVIDYYKAVAKIDQVIML